GLLAASVVVPRHGQRSCMSLYVRTAVKDEHEGAGSSIATSSEVAAPPSNGWEGSREQIEIDLLVEGIYRLYGFDFRDYSRSSLRRRVRHAVETERIETISGLQ